MLALLETFVAEPADGDDEIAPSMRRAVKKVDNVSESDATFVKVKMQAE